MKKFKEELASKIHSFLKERNIMLSVMECDYLANEISDSSFRAGEEKGYQEGLSSKKGKVFRAGINIGKQRKQSRSELIEEIKKWAEERKDKYKTSEPTDFNVGYNNALNDITDILVN